MVRLYDERDKSFEIMGLEEVKKYLGAGFKGCKDAFDIDEKLKSENCGLAGYRCEEVEATEEQIQDIKKNGYNEDNGTKWIRDIQSYKN